MYFLNLSFSETEMVILGGNDDQENLLDLGEIINLETGRDTSDKL